MRCPVHNKEIVEYVKEHYSFTPTPCEIAYVRRKMGYDVVSRSDNPKCNPSEERIKAIEEAIEFFSNKK